MEANLSHEPCTPSATIIIPAHNENRTIGRALEALTRNCAPNEFDIVVVCNGCNDETAAIARRFDGVTVIEIPQPSKTTAIQAGDRVAIAYPRVYMDADVELDTDAARALVYSLADGEVLAA
ncbi:MAG: glycosyltransferase, partial [Antricoccus sp.]